MFSTFKSFWCWLRSYPSLPIPSFPLSLQWFEWNRLLEQSIMDGDLLIFRQLLHPFYRRHHHPFTLASSCRQFFISACRSGDMDTLHYFLTSPELPSLIPEASCLFRSSIFTDSSPPSFLQDAVQYGHLHLLQYFLTSPDLRHFRNDSFYTPAFLDALLLTAVAADRLPLVQYLLTSPSLMDNGYAKPSIDSASFSMLLLQKACYYCRWDVLQYLLVSPDLRQDDGTALFPPSKYQDFLFDQLFPLHFCFWLIDSYGISLTPFIEQKLQEEALNSTSPHLLEYCHHIRERFRVRDEKNTLAHTLHPTLVADHQSASTLRL